MMVARRLTARRRGSLASGPEPLMPELRANAGACGEMRQVGRRAIARRPITRLPRLTIVVTRFGARSVTVGAR